MTLPSTLERAARRRRREDRRLLALFALATLLGGAAVTVLGLGLLFGPLFFVAFSVLALGLGCCQAVVLAPRLTRGVRYVVATVLGGTVSLWIFAAGSVVTDALGPALAWAAVSGAVLGISQALVLTPRSRALLVWTPGSMLAALPARLLLLPALQHGAWLPVALVAGSAAGLTLGQTPALALLLAAQPGAADVPRNDTPSNPGLPS